MTPPPGSPAKPAAIDPLALDPEELQHAVDIARATGETLVRAATHALKNVLNPLSLQLELLRRRLPADAERSHRVVAAMGTAIEAGNATLEHLRADAESPQHTVARGIEMVDLDRAVALALDAVLLPKNGDAPPMPAVLDRRVAPGSTLRTESITLLVALYELIEAALRRRPGRLAIHVRPREGSSGAIIEVVHDGDRAGSSHIPNVRAIAIASALAQVQHGGLSIEDHPDRGVLRLDLPDRH